MQNLLESAVREIYAELRAQHPEYCDCASCQDDVVAHALNATRPRYSGGALTGRALIAVDLQRGQTRATIAVLVLDAMKRVATNPRHPQREARPRAAEEEGSA